MQGDWIAGLIGGAMIGSAAGLLLLGNGRVAGVSGIAGRVLDGLVRRPAQGERAGWRESALFVAGLMLAPLVFAALGGRIEIEVAASVPMLIVAGLLVGFGARLGSGCTSGHGVCGGARLSRRSWVAMATFMATAMVVVAAGRFW